MAALQCEICGGKLIGRSGGLFECDSCGMEFDKEWVKEKIQEIKGTVKVEGTVEVQGTVKVEGPVEVKGGVNIENFLKRGNLALEDKEWEEATRAFDDALNLDAECAEAYVGKLLAETRVKKQSDLKTCAKLFDNSNNYQKAVRFSADDLREILIEYKNENIYHHAKRILDTYEAEEDLAEAAALFKSINGFKEADKLAALCVEKIKNAETEDTYNWAKQLMVQVATETSYKEAAALFEKIGNYKDSAVLVKKCYEEAVRKGKEALSKRKNQTRVAGGLFHTVGLCSDGTVVTEGGNERGQCNVSSWRDVVAIAAGYEHTIGLSSNGTVVAVGYNNNGECHVSGWRDIVAIAAGSYYTVAVKADGTVVATGDNRQGQCNTSTWRNIVSIAATYNFTVGLRPDGTVVSVGNNYFGQGNVFGWRDVVAISAGDTHTVGLKSNGSVIAVGNNDDGQCSVSSWRGIVAIAAGNDHTVGLRSDGRVEAVGNNYSGQCDVSKWENIVSIAAFGRSTFGLRSDGTVVAVGENRNGQYDLSKWKLYSEEEAQGKKETATEMKRRTIERERVEWQVARADFVAEQAKLQAELPTMKGLFSGGRRKEVEARLAQIPARIAEIDSELARIEKELAALG